MKLPKLGKWAEMITYEYAVCEYCGKKCQSLSSHIRFAHKLNVWDYKEEFGYPKSQPLESGRLQEVRAFNNKVYNGSKNIANNTKYQFKKGEIHRDGTMSVYEKERVVKMGLDNAKSQEVQDKRRIKLRESIKTMVRDAHGRFKKWIRG